ncbi:MAG: CapA family protein [Magnetococcales bacterium]|nr:CapA family protein [Magnetococcales bacterium]
MNAWWRWLVGGLFSVSAAWAEPVSLVFVGDVMLDQGPGRVVEQGGDPFVHFASLLRGADLTIGNLELPITTTGVRSSKVYTFRAHPRVVPLLGKYFGLLTVANNHSGDFGRAAFVETLEHLEKANIPYLGGGRNARLAHKPWLVEKKGLRLAFLAYNEFKPRSFEATAEDAGIAWSEDDLVMDDLRAVRPHADVVIPIMHWGWEREEMASRRQRSLARKMIDAGADVVVGGHPHVTQDIEYYKGHLIVYSLGNFVFDGFQSENAHWGWALQMDVDKGGMVRWRTVAAHMDGDGVPHRVAGRETPCGERGSSRVGGCINP